VNSLGRPDWKKSVGVANFRSEPYFLPSFPAPPAFWQGVSFTQFTAFWGEGHRNHAFLRRFHRSGAAVFLLKESQFSEPAMDQILEMPRRCAAKDSDGE
jgi:small subunit ribosomal protein S2